MWNESIRCPVRYLWVCVCVCVCVFVCVCIYIIFSFIPKKKNILHLFWISIIFFFARACLPARLPVWASAWIMKIQHSAFIIPALILQGSAHETPNHFAQPSVCFVGCHITLRADDRRSRGEDYLSRVSVFYANSSLKQINGRHGTTSNSLLRHHRSLSVCKIRLIDRKINPFMTKGSTESYIHIYLVHQYYILVYFITGKK